MEFIIVGSLYGVLFAVIRNKLEKKKEFDYDEWLQDQYNFLAEMRKELI